MEQFLNEYAALLFNNVPEVISVSLVSTLDGSIVAYKARPGVNNRLASSYQVEIFRNAILSLSIKRFSYIITTNQQINF